MHPFRLCQKRLTSLLYAGISMWYCPRIDRWLFVAFGRSRPIRIPISCQTILTVPANSIRIPFCCVCLDIKRKRGSLYLSPVPLIKAFALPTQSERATQKPTPICIYMFWRIACAKTWHIPQTSTVALCLTVYPKVAKFWQAETKTLVNAFLNMFYRPNHLSVRFSAQVWVQK